VPAYVAFDIVWLNGADLRSLPLHERRRVLQTVLPKESPIVSDALSSPLLVCEALSPGSSRHDRFTKRRAFQRNGVAEYWIMDADAGAFEIWHPQDERAALVDHALVWKPLATVGAFELDVQELFASARDEGPLPG